MTILPAGTAAPDFTLDTTSGSPVTLSSFKGKENVLIAFFPAAFTGTCTAEMCSFGDDYSQYTSKNVVVIPISVDQVASLKEFKAKHSMKVEMAADVRRDVAKAYGVLDEKLFRANRAYFLVDKQGVVRWSFMEAKNGERRETAELLAQIAKVAG